MQEDHTPFTGETARVSRRSFISMTAVGALSLPATTPARAALLQLSKQEATLIAAVNSHAILCAEIDKANSAMDDIDERGMPELHVTVRDVATRLLDYPPQMRDFEMYNKGQINRCFQSHLKDFDYLPIGTKLLERIAEDYRCALRVMDERKSAFAKWDIGTGRFQLAQSLSRLYREQERLEDEICELPCSSARMAGIKAKFGAAFIDKHEMEIPGADFLSAILRSMLPLMAEGK